MTDELQYEVIRSNIKNVYIQIRDGKVIVKAPKRITETKISEIIEKKQKWIEKAAQKSLIKEERKEKYTKEEFLEIIQQNLNNLVILTGLKPNKVRVKKIKYAWGSCSSNKNITINEKLICYSQDAIRYVILHELCHIKYMNHSKEFWNLVQSYMPDYKEVKKELK